MNTNIVKGTVFTAKFPVFSGSYRNPKFSHEVIVKGRVVKESYGAKGQHTFTFEVLQSSDEREFAVGSRYRKKGRNIYPNILEVEQPENYLELAREKRARKDKVEAAKEAEREIKERMVEQFIATGMSVESAYRMASEMLG